MKKRLGNIANDITRTIANNSAASADNTNKKTVIANSNQKPANTSNDTVLTSAKAFAEVSTKTVKSKHDLAKKTNQDTLKSEDDSLKRAMEKLQKSDKLEDFKKELKQFLEHLNNVPRLNKEGLNISDPECVVNKQKIINEMQRFSKEAAKWATNLKVNNIEDEKHNILEHKLTIQTNFPKEMKELNGIFVALQHESDKPKQQELLNQICKILSIDPESIKHFYANNSVTPVLPKLLAKDFASIKLPQTQSTPSIPEDGIKDLETLLTEIQNKNGNIQEIESLRLGYARVKNHFTKWQNKTAKEVHNWALSVKGHLAQEDIYEAIAILDRANELVTGGHHLRDTQILSVLTFLGKDSGKLCQIKTGEGKTTIVSILAAIKALQGKSVDIITSNQVLAREGVEEKADFYGLLGLSVSHNNNDAMYKEGPKNCYTADVLYGCISSFQFDYLKDNFKGLGTRADRKFEDVILDEVDSMLIDNAGHIAKLSAPFPGMECFKYIYLNIWKALIAAEKEILGQNNKDITLQQIQVIQNKVISNSTLVDIDFFSFPKLKAYAQGKLSIWIEKAIEARFFVKENEQYVIHKNSSGEREVVPKDIDTGVNLKNTIWSDGLHQFVQLKHNLNVTSESLTSSYISNKGYICLYTNKCGLSGTLGSKLEQELLSQTYNVSCEEIPPYKISKLVREDKISVISDQEWAMTIFASTIDKINSGRAVLIICKTVKELLNLKEFFDSANVKGVNVKTYQDESEARITKEVVKPGDVIIATNISGRGTDLKTKNAGERTSVLEQNGGLHVIVSFLANSRVTEQAEGRTARQGNEGSAKIIVKASDVEATIGVISYNTNIIKQGLTALEENKIREDRKKLAELTFGDELFEYFRKKYRALDENNKKVPGFKYVLKDLEEQWAFWLEGQQRNNSFSGNVEDKYKEFQQLANDTIEKHQIVHNPHYAVLKAGLLLDYNYKDEAEVELKKALSINENLSSAHEKFFDLHIQSGAILTERFVKALAELLFIPYTKNDNYLNDAGNSLAKALQGNIKKECDYLEQHFFPPQKEQQAQDGSPSLESTASSAVPQDLGNNSQVAGNGQSANSQGKSQEPLNSVNKNQETQSASNTSEDLFLKHLSARYYSLKYFLSNIEKLIKDIDSAKGKAGLSIGTQISCSAALHANDNDDNKLKNVVSIQETLDLSTTGLRDIFLLKEIKDVPRDIIIAAQAQIGSGFAALAAGLAFPPILPIMGEIAGILIGEGVSDIVGELIAQQGSGEFDGKAYAKAKVQSLLISACTLGIGAVSSAMKGLQSAQKTFSQIVTNIVKDVLKDIAMQVVAENVINPVLEQVLDLCAVKERITSVVRDTLNNNLDKSKIQHATKEHIDEVAKDILSGDIVYNILKGVGEQLASSSHNWKTKGIGYVLSTLNTIKDIHICPKEFCKYINARLPNDGANNIIESVSEELCQMVSSHMYNMILGLGNKAIFTLPRILRGAYKDYKLSKSTSEHDIVPSSKQAAHADNMLEKYEQLGLPPGSTTEEVLKAYKKKAAECHPDKAVQQLKRELGRDPTPTEIQQKQKELAEKFKLVDGAKNALAPAPKQYHDLSQSAGYNQGDSPHAHTNSDQQFGAPKRNRSTSADEDGDDKMRAKSGSDMDLKNYLDENNSPQHKSQRVSNGDQMTERPRANSLDSIVAHAGDASSISDLADVPAGNNKLPKTDDTSFKNTCATASFAYVVDTPISGLNHGVGGLGEQPKSLNQIQDLVKNNGYHATITSNIDTLQGLLNAVPKNSKVLLAFTRKDGTGHVVVLERGANDEIAIIETRRNSDGSSVMDQNQPEKFTASNVPKYLVSENVREAHIIKVDKNNSTLIEQPPLSKPAPIVATFSASNDSHKTFGAPSKEYMNLGDRDLNKYAIEYDTSKIARFSLANSSLEDGGNLSAITFHSLSDTVKPAVKTAYYCPYKSSATCSNWSGLQQTEVTIPLTDPTYKYLFTAPFSGCSFILAVGANDIKVYHDSNPTIGLDDKMKHLSDNYSRKIIRVDHRDSTSKLQFNNQNIYQTKYSSPEHILRDKEKDGEAHPKTAHMMLVYEDNQWFLKIQNTSLFIPSNSQHFNHNDYTLEKININEVAQTLNIEEQHLKGMGLEEARTISIIDSFSKYNLKAIKNLLELRINSVDLENVEVLDGYYTFQKQYNNIQELFTKLITLKSEIALVPINLHNKHAIGCIFVKQQNGNFKCHYIDPENNAIPEELGQIIADKNIDIEQLPVVHQGHSNCGPEIIEDFMLYITGDRELAGYDTLVMHSELLLKSLMGDSCQYE